MDIWTFEVTLDGISILGPGPSAANTGELHTLRASIEHNSVNSLVFEWILEVHSFGGGPTYEYRTLAKLHDNTNAASNLSYPFGVTIATQTEADGQNGAAFLAGGKLKITLDDNTSMVTLETPLGTSTVSYATALITTGLSWVGWSLYHGWHRPDANADGQSIVEWAGFWTEKNGTRVSGAALGTNQHGDWHQVLGNEWFFGPVGGVRIATANSETATRLQSGWVYNDVLDNPRAVSSDEWRYWNNQGSIGEVPLVVDLCVNRRSGQILAARVKKQTPERVTIAYTEDSGATWADAEADAGIGAFCSPPTLGVTPDGAFSLVFHDGTTAVYWRSVTGGRTWTFVGTFLPILPWGTITVPAHFQHPSGLLLVTYTTGGDFKLGVFSVPTVSVAPIATVTLAAGSANIYPSFEVLPLGGVVIGWSDLTTKTQNRSDNLVTYTNDFTGAASVERRPRAVGHPENGLSLHLYQDSGELKFYPSEDGGVTVLNPPATTIEVGIVDQFADLDVTPVGLLLCVFQSYDMANDNWDLTAYLSGDFGIVWNPA